MNTFSGVPVADPPPPPVLKLVPPLKPDFEPNPVPWDHEFDEAGDFEKQLKVVLENRHIHCPFYDACLDRVIAERWENWTCKNCPGNARRKEGDEG